MYENSSVKYTVRTYEWECFGIPCEYPGTSKMVRARAPEIWTNRSLWHVTRIALG